MGCGEVGCRVWGVGCGENKAAFCLLPIAYCLLPFASCLPSAVPCLPSSQWSLIFDKLGFGELAQPIR
ncbi:MAG: hypothetical protein EWV55_06575 [Microcystis viridis Mv_BB_P_19951000_S69]|uniref:Uncharacterized protein n=1 Tax=Microcystis viridis Mv_BB_P_19951000_S68D TaxID=2486270 RepID=A0A552HYX2_MICVR|nr:MAG: hypothetical protein EWV47_21385 [Microcystis viridis Mv_BB_P_19951000_S68]TRU76378.1 MAG: hypothetical protein EWV77_07185 [Microcystis viridis Mv_BB_P_19951000_S68D]TRU76749.1 MAG: hypothetical protein EWV55_06575 [Microcystis viridis Mv_BB_P_19951000_S69]TRU90745.1 MAG: hypothetical protein EWV46_00960 [Microcystis viridis Mv_BB_P_19951000_S69D]